MTEITKHDNAISESIADDNAITESVAVAKTVTLLTAPLIEIRNRLGRARSLHGSWDINNRPLTADQQTAIIAKLGELQAQFTDDHAALGGVLETWATSSQIASLVGVMALGYAARTGGTPGYAGALLGALVADDLEDYDTTGFTRLEPISAPVIALAITRLWQHDTKFLPSPSEFRDQCLEARKRVSFLRRNVSDMLTKPIPNPPPIPQIAPSSSQSPPSNAVL
jgi:hypothetical protein